MATKKKVAVQALDGEEWISGTPGEDDNWVDYVYKEERKHKMTVQGGLKYISFDHHEFSDGQKDASWKGIPVIYNELEAAQKAIVIQDLVVDGTEYKPFFANFLHEGNDFVATVSLGTKTVTITVGSGITITIA